MGETTPRRRFLVTGLLLALGGTCRAAGAQGTEEATKVTFEWLVPDFDVAAVREALPESVSQRPEGGPAQDKAAALFVFAGIVLLPVLAESLIKARKNLTGGLYVERRADGVVKVRREESLNTGEILYVDEKGIQVYRSTSESPLPAVLAGLFRLLGRK